MIIIFILEKAGGQKLQKEGKKRERRRLFFNGKVQTTSHRDKYIRITTRYGTDLGGMTQDTAEEKIIKKLDLKENDRVTITITKR